MKAQTVFSIKVLRVKMATVKAAFEMWAIISLEEESYFISECITWFAFGS